MPNKLIYLASPYGHAQPASVRHFRYMAVLEAEAALMKQGLMVYSPIVHRHPGALLGLYPLGWDYWKTFDELILSRCDELYVLMLEGWSQSTGVAAEIEIAEHLGKPVTPIDPLTLLAPLSR